MAPPAGAPGSPTCRPTRTPEIRRHGPRAAPADGVRSRAPRSRPSQQRPEKDLIHVRRNRSRRTEAPLRRRLERQFRRHPQLPLDPDLQRERSHGDAGRDQRDGRCLDPPGHHHRDRRAHRRRQRQRQDQPPGRGRRRCRCDARSPGRDRQRRYLRVHRLGGRYLELRHSGDRQRHVQGHDGRPRQRFQCRDRLCGVRHRRHPDAQRHHHRRPDRGSHPVRGHSR